MSDFCKFILTFISLFLCCIIGEKAGVTGHIFNTVGSGVKGGGTPGYACYGATKRGLPQVSIESFV